MGSLDYATFKIRRDTAVNWTSNNPTPLEGEWCLEKDTGNIKIGDGSTAWTALGYRQQLPFTYDLTSANITHTLPIITGFPQTESIYWTNGGTYTLTLAVSDSETVGGIAASTWLGEGDGHMLLESDGTNWQVEVYEDHGKFTDSGVDTLRYYNKYSDGTMSQGGTHTGTLTSLTTITMPKSFIYGNNFVSVTQIPINANATITTLYGQAANTFEMAWSAIGVGNIVKWQSIGKWTDLLD